MKTITIGSKVRLVDGLKARKIDGGRVIFFKSGLIGFVVLVNNNKCRVHLNPTETNRDFSIVDLPINSLQIES